MNNSVDLSVLVLSPVLFQPLEEDDLSGDGRGDDWDTHTKSFEQDKDEIYVREGDRGKWQGHRHILQATTGFLKEESSTLEEARDTHMSSLLVSWLDAQATFGSDSSFAETAQGVPISGETIVHVSIGSLEDDERLKERQSSHKFAQSSSMPDVFLKKGQTNRVRAKNLLFLLSAFRDAKCSAHHGKLLRSDSLKSSQINDAALANVLLVKEMLRPQTEASPLQSNVPTRLILQQGLPCHLSCISTMNEEVVEGPELKSLTWLEGPASEALSSEFIYHYSV
jgi:hypothetical protein